MNTQPEKNVESIPCPQCGWNLTRHEAIDYFDDEGNKRIAPYLRYSCRRCELTDVDEHGNRAPIPLPNGTMLTRPREKCSDCGSTLLSTPISDYVKDGRSIHVPWFGFNCPKCGKYALPGGTRYGIIEPEDLVIPERLKELWDIDLRNLLKIRDKATGQGIFKFCFSPESKEFFWGIRPQDHKTLVRNMGKLAFGEYVRGIIFRERNIIYLRDHAERERLIAAKRLLRRMGVPKDMRVDWGAEVAVELKDELAGI
ncbi:MAG: hypothetical protein A2W25_00340 [candidate division Zixibacteria bacterium RBG_16_53_22]|nr:MAG: hypothetical protein A2W25_00340 [candidate division Zixibacteria bacterium RBG_16_53_22]